MKVRMVQGAVVSWDRVSGSGFWKTLGAQILGSGLKLGFQNLVSGANLGGCRLDH